MEPRDKGGYRSLSDAAGPNVSEARAGLESPIVSADPPLGRGRQYETETITKAGIRLDSPG